MYKRQMANGKGFLHEHPATAVSRDEKTIRGLLMHQAVTFVVADQGRYGLTTRGNNGQPMPAMKHTRFKQTQFRWLRCCRKDATDNKSIKL